MHFLARLAAQPFAKKTCRRGKRRAAARTVSSLVANVHRPLLRSSSMLIGAAIAPKRKKPSVQVKASLRGGIQPISLAQFTLKRFIEQMY